MTIEEAIEHCKEVSNSCGSKLCSLDHLQLMSWLQELVCLRKEQHNMNVNNQETKTLFVYNVFKNTIIKIEAYYKPFPSYGLYFKYNNQECWYDERENTGLIQHLKPKNYSAYAGVLVSCDEVAINKVKESFKLAFNSFYSDIYSGIKTTYDIYLKGWKNDS